MSWVDKVQEQNERAIDLIKCGEFDGYTVLRLPNGMRQILLTPKGSTKKAIGKLLEELSEDAG